MTFLKTRFTKIKINNGVQKAMTKVDKRLFFNKQYLL